MAVDFSKIVGLGRESQVFVMVETTYGVEVKPNTTSQVLLAGDATISQKLGLIGDPQRRPTFSARPQIVGRHEPGTLSLPVLIKPRALGVSPDAGKLLKAIFGRETIVASTSVTYEPLRLADTRQSLTIWVRAGHMVYRALGAVLTKVTFPMKADNSDEALGRGTFDGIFAELRHTGTDALAVAAVLGATTITVVDADKYSTDSYIKIGANDNGGVGYRVTNANYTTNVLTITPGLTAAALVDDLVTPWVPVGVEAGVIVHGRNGTVTRGGIPLPLMSGAITYEMPVRVLTEEKNGLAYATRFVSTGERTVRVEADVVFDAGGGKWPRHANSGTTADFICNWGDTAAARYQVTVKNQIIESPEVSGDELQVVKVQGNGSASVAYDDESKMVFN